MSGPSKSKVDSMGSFWHGLSGRLIEHVFYGCLVILLCAPGATEAQNGAGLSPAVVNPQPDRNGVDVATLQYSVVSPFSFNAPAAGHLAARFLFNGRSFTNTLETYLADNTLTSASADPNSRQITVHSDGMDRIFVCPGIVVCTQVAKIDGAQLTRTGSTSYSYLGPDGTAISFFSPMYINTLPACGSDDASCNDAGYSGYTYASSIKYPDGEQITFGAQPTFSGGSLIMTASSNVGYTLDIAYSCPSCTYNSSWQYYWTAYSASFGSPTYTLRQNGTALGNFSASVTLTNNSASTNLGAPAESEVIVISDSINRTFQVSMQSWVESQCNTPNGFGSAYLVPTRVLSPNGVETDVAYNTTTLISGSFVPVTSVTIGGNVWSYSFNQSAQSMTVKDPLGNSRARTYTSYVVPWGNGISTACMAAFGSDVVQNVDELSRLSQFTYASQGAVGSATLPELNGFSYLYDSRGNITKVTRAPKPNSGLGATVTYQANYDATCDNPVKCNKPNWTQDAKGAQTDYQYDPVHGGETLATLPADASGVRPHRASSYEAVNTGSGTIYRLKQISECMTLASCVGTSDEILHIYSYLGNTFLRTSETRQAGNGGGALTTNYAYDGAGRLIQQTSPAGASSWFLYDAVGRKVGTIGADPDGAGPLPQIAQRLTYNNDDQVTRVEDGTVTGSTAAALAAMNVVRVTNNTYNSIGQKIQVSVSGAGGSTTLTQFSYDTVGRPLCTVVRMNPAAFGSVTNACTLGPAGVQGPDRITKNIYDAAGQLVQVRKAVGTSLEQAYSTYAFTPNGKPQAIIDADGNQNGLVYDGFDRQLQWRFPAPTAVSGYVSSTPAQAFATAGAANPADYEQYGYDLNDNRTSVRKRDGQSITYGFDALDRMTLKTPPLASSIVSYSYTLQGLPLNALFTATGQGILQAYDVFGRRRSSTSTMGGYSRTIGYSYDLDSNLITVTHPDGTYFQYTYDGMDRFTGILENGGTSVVGQSYYPNGLRSTQSRGGVITNYGYQDNLLLASIQDNLAGTASVTTTFTYNSANQLLTRMQTNDAYAYTAAAAGSTSYGINGLNQYTTVGGTGFSYDGRGNLQSDGSTTYGYDAENRLLTASGAHTATLSYDPLGRLFQIVSGTNTTQFLYSGDALVAEYNSAGAVTNRYVHGPQVDNPAIWYQGAAVSPSSRLSLQVDHQGSVVSVADASGNAVTLDTYDEYGMPGASNSGRFQYTGQAWIGELGLHYYKARFYNPSLGRFLQTDPVGYQDDLNLYAYVGNDPLDHSDPMGTKCETAQNGPGETAPGPACQFDEFKDNKGNTISREQATQGGNWFTRLLKMDAKSRVARQEAQMTDKYKKALAMKANGGSVTVRGNASLGVADQTISGDRIVGAMETTKLIESAQPNNVNAAETAKWAATGMVRDITFFGNGALAPFEQSFGHEELHSAYTWSGSDHGWDTPGEKYQQAHQKPFNDASDAFQ